MKGGRFGVRRSSRGVNSKEWTGAQIAGIASAATGAGWIVDPPTMIDDYESPTLIRLLVAVKAGLVSAATESQNFVMGIYVATGDEDDATLPTILWDPADDQNSDWVYRWVGPFIIGNPAGTEATNGGADIVIDVRTKRKVPRGAGILAVFQSQTTDGTGAVNTNFTCDVRALIISG